MAPQTHSPPTVEAVMHSPVVSVAADDSLWAAMDVMLSRGLRHVVVVRGETAVGVLADRDLAAVWAMDPLGLKHRHTSDVVVPAPSFVAPEVDVVTAAVRMRSQGVDALVVMDDQDRPVGMVTDHDLLGVLAGMLGGEVGGLSPRYHGAGHSVLLPD